MGKGGVENVPNTPTLIVAEHEASGSYQRQVGITKNVVFCHHSASPPLVRQRLLMP